MAQPRRWVTALAGGMTASAVLLSPAGAADGSAGRAVNLEQRNAFSTELNAVTGVAPDDVWAVGSLLSSKSFLERPLVLHKDTTTWHRVDVPGRATVTNTLNAVDADAPDDVWAVGAYGASAALIEHMDGSRWRRVQGPDLGGATGVTLNGVTVVSASDVWAVGGLLHGFTDGTLVEHWDGAAWTQVPAPPDGYLTAVDAVSATDVWAVGFDIVDSTTRALILHWDGTRWTRVRAHLGGAQFTDVSLNGVSAASSADVWAVGQGLDANSGTRRALVAHWDGSAWSTVPSFGRPGARSWLQAVSATSPSDVWAAGALSGSTGQSTLIEHWDGTRWSRAASPSPGKETELRGVDGLDADNAWTVGDRDSQSPTRRIALTWDGSVWRLG